jgi:hypothetical protein
VKIRDLIIKLGEGAPSAATTADLRIVALEGHQNETACYTTFAQRQSFSANRRH